MQAVVDDELLAHHNQHEDADQANAEHVGDDSLHHRLINILHVQDSQDALQTSRTVLDCCDVLCATCMATQ